MKPIKKYSMTTNVILLLIAVFCIIIGLIMATTEQPDNNYEDKNH